MCSKNMPLCPQQCPDRQKKVLVEGEESRRAGAFCPDLHGLFCFHKENTDYNYADSQIQKLVVRLPVRQHVLKA